MALFGNKPKSAQQKAQWAKTRILLRAVCLVYLIFYVIVPLIRTPQDGEEAIDPVLRIIIIAVFVIVTGVFSVLTILEYLRNRKEGRYEAGAYEDDEGLGETEASAEERNQEDRDQEDRDQDDSG